MTALPVRVFICYKKILSGGAPNEKADTLFFILKNDEGRFDPWVDDSGLAAGMAWETEIYRRLLASDVLLVLLGRGTSESQWVRREIALATALGIEIVPVGFDMTGDELVIEMKALDIDHLQGGVTDNIKMTRAEALLAELRPAIAAANQRTRDKQKDALKDLLARFAPQPAPRAAKAADNQRAASFVLPVGDNSIALHIASGDLVKLRDIDVLVNSENDYMQMARFFESRTVSSILRRRGASFRDGRYFDTIQTELDWALRDRGRPVNATEVFPTSAGGPQSDLGRINKARYVFHVAAVQAVDSAATMIAFHEPDQVEACVRATLRKLVEINRLDGVISRDGTEARIDQEARAAAGTGRARSVLFPLFGTGEGRASASATIAPILGGIQGFLADEDDGELAATLTDIYISAFRQQDLDEVGEYLSDALA